MASKTQKGRFRRFIWKLLFKLFGTPPDLAEARDALEELRHQVESQNLKLMQLDKELEKVREERLQWMARESTTRKELQDCQERSKDLLEQVVQLTHQQREAKKSLFDHQFKTSTTPLERNRYEMELADARAKQKQAEERAKRAEEKTARLRELENQLGRMKDLELKVEWEKRQSEIQQKALAATLEKMKGLEVQLVQLKKRPPSLRRYRRPTIRLSQPPPPVMSEPPREILDLPIAPRISGSIGPSKPPAQE